MKTKQLVMCGFVLTIASAFLTGGKEGLQQIQAGRDSERLYAQSLTSNKVATVNTGKESQLAWDMVKQEGVVQVVGLTPKVNEWSFVSVPLSVGQVVTVGGKKEQPYAPGTLLGDSTGHIGRVGLTGKVESPINGAQNPGFLPVIPADNMQTYSQTLLALKGRSNMPQAVVSSLQELAARRVDIEAKSQMPPISQTPSVSPIAPIKKVEELPVRQSPQPPQAPVPQQPTTEVAKTGDYPTFKETETVSDLPKVNLN